jgi:hypothetical protein
MAQRGDAARNVLGNRQALVRIALACDLDQIFVAGDEAQGGSNPQEKDRPKNICLSEWLVRIASSVKVFSAITTLGSTVRARVADGT